MRQVERLLALARGAISVLAFPAAVFAQAEWLSPTLGQAMFRGDFRETYYLDERVKGQGTKLRIIESRLSLTGPLWQNASDELSISGSARFQDLDTDAVLPATGVRLPGELWDIRFGPTYRHKFDNGWIAGVNVAVGAHGLRQRRGCLREQAGDHQHSRASDARRHRLAALRR
jgi:hypothetical protein